MDILKRFLYTRNEYDKKHLSMDWNLDVRPDSDHTVLFPPLSRPEIKRLQELTNGIFATSFINEQAEPPGKYFFGGFLLLPFPCPSG